MYIVEKSIPIPRIIRTRYQGRYPFDKMRVGDSFYVPCLSGTTCANIQWSVNSAARYYQRKWKSKFQLTARTINGSGVRFWRVK